MAIIKRKTNKAELDELIEYWLECPRASSYHIAPPIAGQHADYMVTQLRAFKTGYRRGDSDFGNMMSNTIKFYSEKDILAAAAYVASLDR